MRSSFTLALNRGRAWLACSALMYARAREELMNARSSSEGVPSVRMISFSWSM